MRLQSDERLAELAVAGHEAAFVAIVDRYRGPLLRYSAGIVGDGRADDAVQQTFISAHDALQQTSEVQHLRSWLYRIARNASLNLLRAVRDDVPLDAGHVAAPADEPAAAFEQTERLRATLDAVRDLPERQRAALVLRELEGRSHEEIAAALGVSMGSARQHLMRARIAVRGAVTAITPYPLVAKLAAVVAGPGPAPWVDAAVGAGAGATVAKLTAGVMATSALVGGAVGTEHAVHHRHHRTAVAEVARAKQPTRATKNAALTLPVSHDDEGADPVAAQYRAPAHAEKNKNKNKAPHPKHKAEHPIPPAPGHDNAHHSDASGPADTGRDAAADAHDGTRGRDAAGHGHDGTHGRDAVGHGHRGHDGSHGDEHASHDDRRLSSADHNHSDARDHPRVITAADDHDAAARHDHHHAGAAPEARDASGNTNTNSEPHDSHHSNEPAVHDRNDSGKNDRHPAAAPHPDPAPPHPHAGETSHTAGNHDANQHASDDQPHPGHNSPDQPSHHH